MKGLICCCARISELLKLDNLNLTHEKKCRSSSDVYFSYQCKCFLFGGPTCGEVINWDLWVPKCWTPRIKGAGWDQVLVFTGWQECVIDLLLMESLGFWLGRCSVIRSVTQQQPTEASPREFVCCFCRLHQIIDVSSNLWSYVRPALNKHLLLFPWFV